jgi:single-stranded DNA-specific DHH superfamily exonuclease
METQDVTTSKDTQQPTKPRIRKRSIAVQLQAALNAAEVLDRADASELTISRIKLAQTRLVVLSKALNRERSTKLEKALAEVEKLTAENERLKQELTAKPAARPMTDIEQALAQYEEEKRRNERVD